MPRTSEPRPAPGDLALVQAFVNTVTPERDRLANPRQLAVWLARHGLLDAGVELDGEDLKRVHDARRGLRDLLAARMAGRKADAGTLARLLRAAAGARPDVRFDDGGPAGFFSASRRLDDALGTILAATAAARQARQWPLLKLCARKACRRAFFDLSQSRTGKWCCARCGDRVRAAVYRRRR